MWPPVGPGAANSLWKSSLEAGKCHHTRAEGWCLKQSVTRKNKRFCFAAPVAISIFISNFYSLTAISDLAYFQTTEEIIFLISQWSYHTPLEVYLLNARMELLPIFFLFSLSLEFSIHWLKIWILQYLSLYLYWLLFFFFDMLHN